MSDVWVSWRDASLRFMSAGRRRGEIRRTRHDALAKAHEHSDRDAAILKELLESPRLAHHARLLLSAVIRETSSKIGLDTWKEGDPKIPCVSRDALEDLLHGLMRAALAPAELNLLLESVNLRRCQLIHTKSYLPGDFDHRMEKELQETISDILAICDLKEASKPKKI